MSNRRQRILDAQAYLLHALSWRETSQIIQIFSRDHGVISMVAKGAKRPHSALRPVLNAFQPLSVSWAGGGEVKTLIRAESMGIVPLAGYAYMSAWYMNELLLGLLAREDPHPAVFDAYKNALEQLAKTTNYYANHNGGESNQVPSSISVSALLRRFEWVLLQESGYGFDVEMPDFNVSEQERVIRPILRERINGLIGKPLQTRKVMMELHRS